MYLLIDFLKIQTKEPFFPKYNDAVIYLFERYLAGVLEVGPLPPEVDMRLVPDDEHYVGGDLVGGLVTLALERDLGPGLPARLHELLVKSQQIIWTGRNDERPNSRGSS